MNVSFRCLSRLNPVVFVAAAFSFCNAAGRNAIVVADSASGTPLPSASVFDCKGNAIGVSDLKGRLPYVSAAGFPVTVRYLGYRERFVPAPDCDTVFMEPVFTELPEVVIESKQHKILHMLAYVREFSTLATYTDTVFLFREKTVDFMVPSHAKTSFEGWLYPRTLNCKSYYRFTDRYGLDSVSDSWHHHFSWADWGAPPAALTMSHRLAEATDAADTLMGRYSPAEVWTRNDDRLSVDIDVLADTVCRRRVPGFAPFFRKDLDFDNFRVRFNYDNIVGPEVAHNELTGYSFNIESNGRGHDMFMFNKADEPFFVSTYAETYILDKEYITVKEARKWQKLKDGIAGIDILRPSEIGELQPSVVQLVERVEAVNRGEIRLGMTPDHRLAGKTGITQNIGTRFLQMLKTMTGISRAKAQRSWNKQWKDFRKSRTAAVQQQRNPDSDSEE